MWWNRALHPAAFCTGYAILHTLWWPKLFKVDLPLCVDLKNQFSKIHTTMCSNGNANTIINEMKWNFYIKKNSFKKYEIKWFDCAWTVNVNTVWTSNWNTQTKCIKKIDKKNNRNVEQKRFGIKLEINKNFVVIFFFLFFSSFFWWYLFRLSFLTCINKQWWCVPTPLVSRNARTISNG